MQGLIKSAVPIKSFTNSTVHTDKRFCNAIRWCTGLPCLITVNFRSDAEEPLGRIDTGVHKDANVNISTPLDRPKHKEKSLSTQSSHFELERTPDRVSISKDL